MLGKLTVSNTTYGRNALSLKQKFIIWNVAALALVAGALVTVINYPAPLQLEISLTDTLKLGGYIAPLYSEEGDQRCGVILHGGYSFHTHTFFIDTCAQAIVDQNEVVLFYW